nr:uncharacterized protein CI109_004461 [Kwoniella shandongensis]KAA5527169.1 hypothetical protein CI109_004461 [Kwoniella shandongensis]
MSTSIPSQMTYNELASLVHGSPTSTESFDESVDFSSFNEVNAVLTMGYVGSHSWLLEVANHRVDVRLEGWKNLVPLDRLPQGLPECGEVQIGTEAMIHASSARYDQKSNEEVVAELLGRISHGTKDREGCHDEQSRKRTFDGEDEDEFVPRALNSFTMYATRRRHGFVTMFPSLSFAQVSVLLGAEWSYLKDEKKDDYLYWTTLADVYKREYYKIYPKVSWPMYSKKMAERKQHGAERGGEDDRRSRSSVKRKRQSSDEQSTSLFITSPLSNSSP